MKTIKLEQGIPIPEGFRGRPRGGGKWAELFERANVGDSFLIANSVQLYVHKCAKKYGVRIKTQKVDGSNRRVWILSKGESNGN